MKMEITQQQRRETDTRFACLRSSNLLHFDTRSFPTPSVIRM